MTGNNTKSPLIYLVDEEPIVEENDAIISASVELRDHLDIINHSLHLIAELPRQILHTNADELIVQRLIVRCFNSAASSLRLARCGYYQPAFAMLRDVVEITFLLDLFAHDPAEIAQWHTLPADEREKRYKPWRVRKRLDERDGNKKGLRGAAYKALSAYAAHPTPEGFSIISPNALTKIGPFPDADRITACFQELAKNVSYAALVIGKHTPKGTVRTFRRLFTLAKKESTRKRDLNLSALRSKIYSETLRRSLPIIQSMKTILKAVGIQVQVVLTVALLVACSLNVMFVCAALGL